ncbi:MAG: hypothetical protein CENE_02469 [Candidatus Celerinatantimonas neptuna]|nr:MAG: hypothetical protein CENE_02469 [Candidatus Celerinatantimonas neptuna]
MQTVNNNSSVMANVSKWVSDKVSPSQQSSDFASQLAKAQGTTQSRLLGGLSAQSGTQSAMRSEFTAIGTGIGLGLLASFAGSDGNAPQFGTTGDDKSGDNGAGVPLGEAAPEKLEFGVKPDKSENAQASASSTQNTAENNTEAAANTNNGATQNTAANSDTTTENASQNTASNQVAQATTAGAQNAPKAPVPEYGIGQFFDKLFGNGTSATPETALTNTGNNSNNNNV